MELSESKIREYMSRLVGARTRLLCNHGFYGLLVMHMKFALDSELDTAATDGEKTYFSPAFLDDIDDKELDFVLMHEILHVVLRHCFRYGERNRLLFNIACDIVVNSTIMQEKGGDEKSITLRKYGVAMHLTPDGREGYLFTAEEVYDMLLSSGKYRKKAGIGEGLGGGENEGKKGKGKGKGTNGGKGGDGYGWDSHERWGKHGENTPVADAWAKRFLDACEGVNARAAITGVGDLPLFAERMLKDLLNGQVDWRVILNEFVQEDVCDYSFSPPDKRFSSSPFLLPDFNEREDSVRDLLFFVDTSGSISTDDLTAAYSEIKGAIEQFHNRLQGKLAFFDASVKEPIYDFEDVDSLLSIRPVGGGGTSFYAVFDYVAKKMKHELPSMIIILTDGYAAFPNEAAAMDVPVLWVLNNDDITPPWGKVARIKVR